MTALSSRPPASRTVFRQDLPTALVDALSEHFTCREAVRFDMFSLFAVVDYKVDAILEHCLLNPTCFNSSSAPASRAIILAIHL